MLVCNHIDIYKSDKHIIRNFSQVFALDKNYFITGQLGCGKTLIFKSISGIDAPTKGRVKYCSKDIYELSTQQRIDLMNDFGIILSSPTCLSNLNLGNNLKLVSKIKNCPEEKYFELLKSADLDQKLSLYLNQLNFFEAQLYSIILAIAHKPKILIWDNCPLDQNSYLMDQVKPWLLELKNTGTTMIFLGEEQPSVVSDFETIILPNHLMKEFYQQREEHLTNTGKAS